MLSLFTCFFSCYNSLVIAAKGELIVATFIEREESILPLVPLIQYQKKFSLANYQYSKTVDSHIAISKHSNIKEYAERLSKQLQIFETDGTIKAIRMKSYN